MLASPNWWHSKEGAAHKDVVPLVKQLETQQSYRQLENLRHVRLYGNLDILGLNSLGYSRPNPSTINNRVTLNVIQSCVDTAKAKICKTRPRPTFLTSGGDWSLQKKAKKLEKFVNGVFYESKLYEKSPMSFLDAGVFGTGGVKIFNDEGKPGFERAFVNECFVDDSEALYGDPRSFYQKKSVNREVLASMFPKFEGQIRLLQPINTAQGAMAFAKHADQVEVFEAWHLNSSSKSGDGRHVIAIDGADLEHEEWTKPYFPFEWIKWNPKIFGFWGQGIAEQLVGNQIEINKLLKNIQIAHHLCSAPMVSIEDGSKVISAHMSNEIGRIVKYKGTKPTIDVFNSVAPELYQHLERLYQKAFEIVGISQLSAQAHKPSGLNSGKALREYNDIETERFSQVGRAWEMFHMGCAEKAIDMAKDLYSKDKDLSVRVKGKKFIETIKWSEVDMNEDDYIMQIFPTSQLPNEPAGRMEYVQELTQAGFIDPDTATDLLDFPDIESAMSLSHAARNVVKEIIEKMIEDTVYTSPEPFMNLNFAVQYGQMAYNKAKLDGCPEINLELLRRFIEQADFMRQPPPQPQQAISQPQPGMGVAAPPPVSPLLPTQAA